MFWCEPKDVTKADSASCLLRRKTFATMVPSQVKKARRPSQKEKKTSHQSFREKHNS